MADARAIVFLGPSMPLDAARRILDADYRVPIRRGDLVNLAPGSVVGIIDGAFEQDLSVSPREVHEALERGVVIFGGASMGALRAAEVPGAIGVGRVFEWYRDAVVTRDDEVAVLFEPELGRALTVPAVNVRYAVERLSSLGTIGQDVGEALLEAALAMSFKDRSWEEIIRAAGIAGRADEEDLIAMLEAYDLKQQDAQAVLEAIDSYFGTLPRTEVRGTITGTTGASSPSPEGGSRDGDIFIWETGDRVSFDDLAAFLIFTGRFDGHARQIIAQLAVAGGASVTSAGGGQKESQALFIATVTRWGWKSAEEARVTMADLGLDEETVGEACSKELKVEDVVSMLARENRVALRDALIGRLFLDEMALKRETMRLGALNVLAEAVTEAPTPESLEQARSVLCKATGSLSFNHLRRRWARAGLAEHTQTKLLDRLARARTHGRRLVDAMNGRGSAAPVGTVGTPAFPLAACPKPPGESRFCNELAAAERHARRIGEVIGITRIGMIGELGDLGGVQVAQAARPGNSWSSSYGSGKARSKAGAVVGSIMEEVEKWAQENFRAGSYPVEGSYSKLAAQGCFVDPATLDLPFDTIYRDDLVLNWHPAADLLTGRTVHLPVDLLQIQRRKHDICFTRRGARKHLVTNGLGSGFSREEAVLHGLCEYVERHAQRLSELFLANPGGIGEPPFRFVDLASASEAVRDIAERISRNGTLRVLDITSDVAIPTFAAALVRDGQIANGYGTHPNPDTAIEMALLEAAQTIASAVAGGREDLSIRARSLGRHERPRPVGPREGWFWLDPDPVYRPVDAIEGLRSADVRDDLLWALDRVRTAGVDHVIVVDLTDAAIAPAHAVRVIVPDLETNNPFYTGLRARLVLLRDILPKWR
jgi:ribosomal protein S12 methylthiotransferase accessory factor